MAKLIIQIPCFNEEETLPQTVRDLPRALPGVDRIEILVIDDGSTDGTVATARALGVDHILPLGVNRGLARAFSAGLDFAVRHGADIIVNTDGDNQYRGADVARLVEPVLAGQADIVIGARPIEEIEDFSFVKKRLQRLGSRVVSALASVKVPDATSGFRAMSREAASRLLVTTPFTYTLDTLFQAPAKGLLVRSVPVGTNPMTRPSRLFRNIPVYLWRSLDTIFRVFTVYKPILFFSLLGTLIFLPGFVLGLRFLYFVLHGDSDGHVQSLILAAVLLIAGFQVYLTGILAHLSSTNRKIMEEMLYQLRRHGSVAGDESPAGPAAARGADPRP